MQADSLIITPNRRLASVLRAKLEEQIAVNQPGGFITPTVLPINVWLTNLWQDHSRQTYTALPHLLNSTQEFMLWETIIRESPWHEYLLQVAETAHLVKAAHGLLQQWQVDQSDPLFGTADDYAACRHWLNAFKVKCKEGNWIDNASLTSLIIELIKQKIIILPPNIYHAGFTSLSPQLTYLFECARESGSQVLIYELPTETASVSRTDAENVDEEILAMARFAKECHINEPNASIACVFPSLDKQRERVKQLFTEILGDTELFNLSAGKPLAEYPVVRAALQILGLSTTQLTIDDAAFLLSTPFIAGGESEYLRRAQLDQRLRARNFSTVTRDNISCTQLNKHLQALQVLLEEYTDKVSYFKWAERFNQLLKAIGWPGERVLNSEEYQVVNEWITALQELTTLDVTSPPVGYQTALHALIQLVKAKPFQAQTPAAPIQILGVLEASGLTFDYLWLSGLDDNSWPTQPKPNPFIPKKLQRDLNMPHASAERELVYCQTMLNQFTHSARRVILSYAKQQDETPLSSSPLIRSYPAIQLHELITTPVPMLNEIIFDHKKMETIVDNQAPAYQSNDVIIGGVDIIKQQALCPFKAFAECRLGAKPLEHPLPGLRPKERGTIVHQILEKCWQTLRDRDGLVAMHDEELHALLSCIIDHALLDHAKAQQHQGSYLQLEKQRLLKLMLNWLSIEKERPPFSVVASEKNSSITLGELTINMRIDRIDSLADGSKLIIDYKTSSRIAVSDWLGERMEAPQLPLYAQLDPANTSGIAYAQVIMNQSKFKGISRDDLDINGIKPSEKVTDNKNWHTLNTEWQHSLTTLSQAFCDGIAEVDPKEQDKTCKHCQLQPLCRIHESQ